MKVRFTPEADAQADASDQWWREHRTHARDLFARELATMTALLSETPTLGTIYAVRQGKHLRRVLMPRTRHHLYYVVEAHEIVVHAVWGAPRAHGPPL